MSGILKRRHEEDTSPYLSLQGCHDNEVSCSDSGNSSDSLNHPVPAVGHDSLPPQLQLPHDANNGINDDHPLHDGDTLPPAQRHDDDSGQPQALHLAPKRARPGRGVRFESVTVYYFSRRQGFTSVPTQGGSTLGMSPRHCWVHRFTLREFALEQERSHRRMLRHHLRQEKLNAVKLKLANSGAVASNALTLDDVSEDDMPPEHGGGGVVGGVSGVGVGAGVEVDEYFFLQPLSTRRRRALLRASGVRRIDGEERHQLRALRGSREECGCRCRGACDPETCACSLAGIKCQVDRMSFPCGCTKDGCGNATGRLEFNPVRVRTHFLHTIMKLELERSREMQQMQQQPVTNGNGYHGDPSPLAQQHQPVFTTLANGGVPHVPIMHLHEAGEAADVRLQDEVEEEEEDEEDEEEEEDSEEDEEEEEEEEDEAYEDEEDSSLCSGLSDCSTHSLETIDPDEEDEEEDYEEDEEDDDNYDDEEGENNEEWECSLDSASPPPFSHTEVVPLSSVLGFSRNSPLGNHGNDPFSLQAPPSDLRQTDASGSEIAAAAAAAPPHMNPSLSLPAPEPSKTTAVCSAGTKDTPPGGRDLSLATLEPPAPAPQTGAGFGGQGDGGGGEKGTPTGGMKVQQPLVAGETEDRIIAKLSQTDVSCEWAEPTASGTE
ncbi:unnamed protein product [Arctogadus glacialis]